jgi:NADPH:quinone reductase-like Zn-dependent oxidoreductase
MVLCHQRRAMKAPMGGRRFRRDTLGRAPASVADPLASFRLDDRLIVVTGSSAGLGRTFAEAFAKLGARVVLAARRRDKLAEAARAIVAAGGRAEVVPTDTASITT